MNSIIQKEQYNHLIKFNVFYEELLETPNAIQTIIEHTLKLNSNFDFSEYPLFVPKTCFPTETGNHRLRKIEPQSPEVPLTYLKRPNDIEYFNDLLTNLGYLCAE
jgi:hypothetical protein